jgi:hypothetical protein
MSFGSIVSRETLFPNTKPAENLIDDIFPGRNADNFAETIDGFLNIDGDQLKRRPVAYFFGRSNDKLQALLKGDFMP